MLNILGLHVIEGHGRQVAHSETQLSGVPFLKTSALLSSRRHRPLQGIVGASSLDGVMTCGNPASRSSLGSASVPNDDSNRLIKIRRGQPPTMGALR